MDDSKNRKLLFIPEFVLLNVLNSFVNFVRKDYFDSVNTNQNEKTSYLYYLTQNIYVQRLNVFNEAKKIFLIEDENDPKRININLGWPEKNKDGTNVSIIHSGEQYADNTLGVGATSETFKEYIYPEGSTETETNGYRNLHSRRYNANYSIVITGDSTNETIITYNLLKSFFISFEGTANLNFLGFQNVKITGQDLQLKSDIKPNMFAKNLQFQFDYEYEVVEHEKLKYWNGLIFNGIVLK